MKLFDSSSHPAAAEEFLYRFVDDDISVVAPEELLRSVALAATEVLSSARQAPVVIGYKDLPRLTERQLEILEMLNAGRTPKQAREEFWINKNTWETHMSGIHKALGTSRYWEAVKEARRMGILPYPREV